MLFKRKKKKKTLKRYSLVLVPESSPWEEEVLCAWKKYSLIAHRG
jgi:hypothetical protein